MLSKKSSSTLNQTFAIFALSSLNTNTGQSSFDSFIQAIICLPFATGADMSSEHLRRRQNYN